MPLIQANGVTLNYELKGPAGAPVAAFSSSLGATMAMWDGIVPALRGRYRVLRYDARGHGGSPAPRGPVTVEDLAADLRGLLDALGIARAHVVGLSLGGMTAQALAASEPGRVESLTLVATSAHMPTREAWAERAALVRSRGMGAVAEAVLGRWFTPGFAERAPEPATAAREAFLAVDPEGYAACCEAIGGMDLRPVLSRIVAPTLVIAGADDPATPPAPHAEALRDGIRNAEYVVLPRAAHLLAVERPDAVAAYLLAFLDRHRDPAADRAPASFPFENGVENRRAVLGDAHVDRSMNGATPFTRPWQDFVSRAAWGEVWGDPRLPWKTRSVIVLAMMVALHREEEFKLHLKPALGNGLTVGELQALLLQAAIYGGVPAANAAFRWAREVLGDEAG